MKFTQLSKAKNADKYYLLRGTLSEEIAQSTVYHYLRQIYVYLHFTIHAESQWSEEQWRPLMSFEQMGEVDLPPGVSEIPAGPFGG